MKTARSRDPTPATMLFTKSAWPGTSMMPISCCLALSSRDMCAKPSSMVTPRFFSSGRRSGSIPVRALTSEDLPWSM